MNPLAAACARISSQFAAIATELEELERSTGIVLPSLQAHEQQVVDQRTTMKGRELVSPKDEIDLLCLDARGFRRLRADHAAPAEVLTAREFANLLRVDLRTLRALRRAGAVPAGFLIGRSPRWRRTEIDAWLAKQR